MVVSKARVRAALPSVSMVLMVVLGFVVSLMFSAVAGENPVHVFNIMVESAAGSRYDLGMTLFYSSPLIFTGLSVAFAYRAGLFNIGAEGQLTIGALAASVFALAFPGLPAFIAPLMAGAVAFAGGALWGYIPGWLKTRRGSHEVITTIMLNFIALALSSYVVLYLIPNPGSQNPESAVFAKSYHLSHLSAFPDTPLSLALFLGLIICLLLHFVFEKTGFGFRLRVIGLNEKVAKSSGIDVPGGKVAAMTIAGGLAGLVAVVEVLGNSGQFKLGFSPGYGYAGIAIALMARGRPLGVIFASLLFGALIKGASDLDFETDYMTKDLALIVQGIVILFIASDRLLKLTRKRLEGLLQC